MRWVTLLALIVLAATMLFSACSRTGIPECDYTPEKIKGDPINNCPGVVYFNAKEGKCMVQGAGRGETCPESAFKVDEANLLAACIQSAQSPGDIEYCGFRVAERTVNDAMALCQDMCEPLN